MRINNEQALNNILSLDLYRIVSTKSMPLIVCAYKFEEKNKVGKHRLWGSEAELRSTA